MTAADPNDRRQIPPLRQIAEEGDEAATTAARAILRQVGATGRVDFRLLDRLGPAVRRRLVDLLAAAFAQPGAGSAAAAKAAKPSMSPAGKVAAGDRRSGKPAANAAAAASLPRAYRHWRAQQREAHDFQTRAFRLGVKAAILVAVYAALAVIYFKL